MIEVNTHDHSAIEKRLTRQAEETCLRITAHAHQEMVEEYVKLEDVISVLSQAKVVENYPDHRRGPCCLVYGQDKSGRDLHIVCTTSLVQSMSRDHRNGKRPIREEKENEL